MIEPNLLNSSVWGHLIREGKYDYIPLNVAELQFPTAAPICEELTRLAQTGAYGYTEPFEDFPRLVHDWCLRRHGWEVNMDLVVMVPRVVHLLALIAREYFPAPPIVVTMSPQYSPTLEVLKRNGCAIRTSRLVEEGNVWSVDLANLESVIFGADMLLLCSPHNPTGTVWPRHELEQIARMCEAAGVMVVSDEVHSDSVRHGTHTPFALVAGEGQEWISCIAPGKAFNLAGLETSAIVCSRTETSQWLRGSLRRAGFHNANIFGLRATQIAWSQCDEWLDRTQLELQASFDLAWKVLRQELPGLRPVPAGGTFLLWIDARSVGNEDALRKWFVRDAKVIPGFGSDFGEEYSGWLRLNLGIPRDRLQEVLRRLVSTAPITARSKMNAPSCPASCDSRGSAHTD
ncbi:aminotransferase class I/II-fold pyridoxal phosphate-dependent enzyme [Helcobacillus sp. ACRRO]|uniref:MalY/PatB family protein n=1 Tax=Helcobacillus TaxID=1161125 RepID=UPI001EF72085|nr:MULTISPECIES: aminotransferase class I/II-fold pyridoxal phosphate-dependent enzyme [Helcobacillus]MCG7426833.1 aminotransferase class I/II-fold pyridoxal phosphate-dependent enzyme [Helcobacillus sp. ACRRO]MDK7742054.1 aminotransferase class I/II-fold pyridoxal phosphate-dependent enzyme [Helcobacillus massiliensis]WOO93609.1 aminotransferase class I/II-fold pyridoxal phosphate-dependent enzyme [Helcobacillus massiliensis]